MAKSDYGVDSAYRWQAEQERGGTKRIRARGRNAIMQVRETYKRAGQPIPAGLHLPSPKKKRGKFRTT